MLNKHSQSFCQQHKGPLCVFFRAEERQRSCRSKESLPTPNSGHDGQGSPPPQRGMDNPPQLPGLSSQTPTSAASGKPCRMRCPQRKTSGSHDHWQWRSQGRCWSWRGKRIPCSGILINVTIMATLALGYFIKYFDFKKKKFC